MSLCHLKREKYYRKIWIKNEIKLLSYNYLINNSLVNNKIRAVLFVDKLKKAPKFSRTRLVNFCILSGNPRWVFRKLHYSRQELKKAATKGTLVGFRRASW